MKEWKFKNGIEVYESNYDGALHCFKVYNQDNFLGTINPDTIEDMQECINSLDAGRDPITDGWEDGLGNQCTLSGWSTEE